MLVDPCLRIGRTGGALGENARGGLAELVVVPTANLVPMPDALSDEAAAALPIAHGTALRMLFTKGGIRAGETVAVLSAGGGVGTAAVQIAWAARCRVAAVAASAWKLDRLCELGAELAVDSTTEDWSAAVWAWSNKRGVDVVVDSTGARHLGCVGPDRGRWRGRVVCCGATSGYEAVTDLPYLWRREASIIGSNVWERSDLEELVRMVGATTITPVIDRVVGLEGAAADAPHCAPGFEAARYRPPQQRSWQTRRRIPAIPEQPVRHCCSLRDPQSCGRALRTPQIPSVQDTCRAAVVRRSR